MFLEWAGDERIPAWTAVRTSDFKLIRYADGFEELYDLSGRRWSADPWETTNRATDPRARGTPWAPARASWVASRAPARLARCDRGRSSDLCAAHVFANADRRSGHSSSS